MVSLSCEKKSAWLVTLLFYGECLHITDNDNYVDDADCTRDFTRHANTLAKSPTGSTFPVLRAFLTCYREN